MAQGVDQVLGSVAEMNDCNNMVLFDLEGSFTISGNSPEAASIRKAVRRCRRATEIHRRKNTFYIPLWVQPQPGTDVKEKANPFQRQGRP